jgi:predicted nucleic acid-binding protein
MSASPAAYLDTSAFIKYLIAEPESHALRAFLAAWPRRLSSALLLTEAVRAARPHGDDAVSNARALLADVELFSVSTDVLEAATAVDPRVIRTLDAIHLATADAIRDQIGVLVSYDGSMIDGARLIGLPVASPV